MMLAIPEPDYGADLEPPLHDLLPPVEGAEPNIHEPPMQIRAPTAWRAVWIAPGRRNRGAEGAR
jgi:hypothetical protein